MPLKTPLDLPPLLSFGPPKGRNIEYTRLLVTLHQTFANYFVTFHSMYIVHLTLPWFQFIRIGHINSKLILKSSLSWGLDICKKKSLLFFL